LCLRGVLQRFFFHQEYELLNVAIFRVPPTVLLKIVEGTVQITKSKNRCVFVNV
jgi:hypothetical protein